MVYFLRPFPTEPTSLSFISVGPVLKNEVLGFRKERKRKEKKISQESFFYGNQKFISHLVGNENNGPQVDNLKEERKKGFVRWREPITQISYTKIHLSV